MMRALLLTFWLCVLAPPMVLGAQPPAPDLDALPGCGFTRSAAIEDLRVGAVVLNLETGTGCAENLDEVFQIASVPKIFIAGAYYDWLMQGLVSANTRLTFSERYLMGGRHACLRAEDVGTSYTSRELLEYMINCSDNAATWMLLDSIGPGTVQRYIEATGIEGIGPVAPYSDVDRAKLSLIDPRWEEVPRGLASRFLRMRSTAGLVPQYFPEPPALRSEDLRAASAEYVRTAETNTATPRAIAEYFLKLREDLLSLNGHHALVARSLFNTMLYTQRLHSTQAFPGTVVVGAKNGFDTGLTAEVSLVFSEIGSYVPTALVIVFTQQEDFSDPDLQLPGRENGVLNTYLRALSPRLVELLYPDFTPPPVTTSLQVTATVLHRQDVIAPCWAPYRLSDFDEDRVSALESCLRSIPSRTRYAVGDLVTLAMVLRDLNSSGDTRLVFIYTAPDGRVYSYQTDRRYQSTAGINWFQPLDAAGEWQLDVYLNFEHVYQQAIQVG